MRTNLHNKELIQDFLRTKPNLNDDERRVFTRIPKYLQKLGTDLSLTDSNVTQILYSKSDIVNILHAVDINGVINELFDTFLKRYQDGLETKMTGSSYFFEKVDLLEYHFHKVTLKRGSSYIPSPKWINNKKSTINPQNTEDNNCFQYSIVAALNHQKIPNHSERLNNLKPFIDNYNWNDLEFPAGHKNYSAFEKNNSEIALNIYYLFLTILKKYYLVTYKNKIKLVI